MRYFCGGLVFRCARPNGLAQSVEQSVLIVSVLSALLKAQIQKMYHSVCAQVLGAYQATEDEGMLKCFALLINFKKACVSSTGFVIISLGNLKGVILGRHLAGRSVTDSTARPR